MLDGSWLALVNLALAGQDLPSWLGLLLTWQGLLSAAYLVVSAEPLPAW